jgi:hypothetical protein
MDVFILAGQSNMVGQGVEPAAYSYPTQIKAWNGAWVQASDPLVPVTVDPQAGVGPGIPFADRWVMLRGGTVGLVQAAKGGSYMAEWRPNWRTTTLYGAMIAKARAALNAGGTLRGLIWYQGESDTDEVQKVIDWPYRFREFAFAVRQDLGVPDLPVIYTRLGPEPDVVPFVNWGRMHLYQQGMAGALPAKVAMVNASDLAWKPFDKLHLTTASAVTLGRRYADAMHGLIP